MAANQIVEDDHLARETEAKGPVFIEVCFVLRQEAVGVAPINGVAFTLEIRAAVPAGLRALIPIQTQPAQSVEDGLHGGLCIAGLVGVFDAKDEFTPVSAGV